MSLSRTLQPLRLSARQFSTARPLAARASPVLRAATSYKPYVEGTVNEPTTFPPPSKAHGSYHWSFERGLSAALVPLVAATAVTSANPMIDGLLSVALVVHSHIGFDAVFADYLHPRKFPVIGTAVMWLLRFATGGVLVGVYQFNTNDIGLTELLKKIWKA